MDTINVLKKLPYWTVTPLLEKVLLGVENAYIGQIKRAHYIDNYVVVNGLYIYSPDKDFPDELCYVDSEQKLIQNVGAETTTSIEVFFK